VNYTVSMNDIQMAQGGREGVRVGTGNSTLGLETQLRNEEIPPWWVSHVRNGERTTLDIDATATSGRLGRSVDFSRSREIQTDLLGAFNSRRDATGERRQPADAIPSSTSTKRGASGERQRVGDADRDGVYGVQPEHRAPTVTEIGYDITMNGVEMGSGQTDEGYSIPSYSTETVEFTTALQNRHLDDWWVTHLDEEVRGHQVTGLRIEFYAVIEFPRRGGHHSAGCAHLRGDDRDGHLRRVTTCETPASRRRTGQTTAVTETTAARLRTEQPTAATRPTAETKRTTAHTKTEPMTGRRTEPTTATTGFCRLYVVASASIASSTRLIRALCPM